MNIDLTIQELKEFDGGVVDTSSLIYLQRLFLLALTASRTKLYVLPQVCKEFFLPLPVAVRRLDVVAADTDNAVLIAAQTHGLAVISEDKYILRQAKKTHIPHFNTLMLVLFLRFKNAINEQQYLESVEKLREFAHYGAPVFAFAESVFTTMKSHGELSACFTGIVEKSEHHLHGSIERRK
ncbi:hypothetical protein [Desulfogranum japonicum]|uniref:hypothetical protein n=1 Tax=Desulfogranum japonicum TaxID=231447 RepID=UPI000490DD8C|nr:hypothetical protein [Desulfogranum japonicum]